MTSDRFWSVIEDARQDPARMTALLFAMDQQQLLSFHYDLKDAVAELHDAPFTDHMTTKSEDGAIDVMTWAVSQGKAYYESLWDNPAALPESVEDFPPSSVHDGMTLDIYYRRFGTYPPHRED